MHRRSEAQAPAQSAGGAAGWLNENSERSEERRRSNGRIDLFVKTEKYIYIIEIKLDGTAEEALKQIEEKGYAAPFAADPRYIVKIGVNFGKQTRRLGEWVVDGV